ncbi:MAG: LysE family transporter [Bacteroidales bacterium]|nr:LysE family transporter [Bacteroidales bacterium]
MLIELIKAILIGIMASAPIGPVSLLVMQKTFCHGRMAGFAAGVGSALVDSFYAVASLFAFMFVQDFFSRHEAWIMILGGLLVAGVGCIMLRRKSIDTVSTEDPSKTKAVQYALQAAGCALANPGALAYMFGLVAIFRLDIGEAVSPTWLIVLFVLVGALVWWFSFAFAADKLRNAINVKTLNRVNHIAGLAVIVFGAALLVRGIVLL